MELDKPLVIAGKQYTSRLIVGTGKYPDFQIMKECHALAGVEMVTIAIRRENISDRSQGSVLDYIDPARVDFLPNTAGCYNVEDAVLTCRLAREAGLGTVVKLEVIGDEKTLFPDVIGLVEATKLLVAEGFTVLPYTSDDVVIAKKLQDAGAGAVMPLAAPIGSGLGICNPYTIQILREAITVPLIIDAGVGTASDAARVMELGADAVLMNTAIACAKNPRLMASAMKSAVEAGRAAYLAGRIPRKLYASASSPIEGMIE
ncbi:MAG: thiazole synthase [Planctomycetota bacterium]|nr:thiazole synthase [Planctomycetota bacterium]MDA1138110.1 thiazole synthase [Planctomycetota bacterium]